MIDHLNNAMNAALDKAFFPQIVVAAVLAVAAYVI